MCGRYYIEIDDREIEEITRKVQEKLREEESQLTIKMEGEVFPTDTVPVQTGLFEFTAMKWGFTTFDGKPLINARSETVLEKKMFQESMQKRRCLIPASGYFEWQRDAKKQAEPVGASGIPVSFDASHQSSKQSAKKIKYRFYVPDQTLHLAACWRIEEGKPVFVILTRDAIKGAEVVHERMPVIIPEARIGEWLHESPDAMQDAVTQLVIEAA